MLRGRRGETDRDVAAADGSDRNDAAASPTIETQQRVDTSAEASAETAGSRSERKASVSRRFALVISDLVAMV
jgi:hypothetical protein